MIRFCVLTVVALVIGFRYLTRRLERYQVPAEGAHISNCHLGDSA